MCKSQYATINTCTIYTSTR